MFITKIDLTNFKRFNNLTIDLSNLKLPPKLVLLVGSNGSGKSSIFDAFEYASAMSKDHARIETEYHAKNSNLDSNVHIWLSDNSEYHRIGNSQLKKPSDKNIFYGRSSLRQVSRLTRAAPPQGFDPDADTDRPRFFIDRDDRFENDVPVLMQWLVRDIFRGARSDTAEALRLRYTDQLNQALLRIFGDDPATSLNLVELVPPLDGKTIDIRFKKGISEILYNLLSSGEKEVINVLLNLLVRRENFSDSVYFIDELDLHLNTALQFDLLQEIVDHWIPDSCQLWTASHSLGFIQYANQAPNAVIIDFDQLDFDQPMTLLPEQKSSLDIIEIAVPRTMLASLFRNRTPTYCENTNVAIYNLLGDDNRVFLPAKDKNDVYYSAKNNPQLQALMDRDYITDEEINHLGLKIPNLKILKLYSIENYLYHPDNIQELAPIFDKAAWINHLQVCKTLAYDHILIGLNQARKSYKALSDEKVFDLNGSHIIRNCLKSDDFEKFYPFLDVKSKVDRKMLVLLNLTPHQLAQTKWFKTHIQQVLS